MVVALVPLVRQVEVQLGVVGVAPALLVRTVLEQLVVMAAIQQFKALLKVIVLGAGVEGVEILMAMVLMQNMVGEEEQVHMVLLESHRMEAVLFIVVVVEVQAE
jgi:NADH dehydrogenase FAD-containing subunit